MTLPSPSPRRTARGVWAALVLTVVSVLVLLALVDVRAVAEQVRQSDWRYLAAASAALLAGMAAYALRWRLLLGGRASGLATFYAACVGHAVNILLPLRFGEPARILVLGRSARLSYSQVTSSVVVERLWEQALRLAALAGALAFGAGLRPSPPTLVGAVVLLAAACVGVAVVRRRQAWLLAIVPRWLARLPRLQELAVRQSLTRLLAGLALASTPSRLLQGGLTSLAAWAAFWAFHALALLALPGHLSLREVVTLALGALALAPPSAPTSPGVYHASLVVPLVLVGYADTTVTAYAVVLHALLMVWLVPLGLVGLLRSGVPAKEVLPAP